MTHRMILATADLKTVYKVVEEKQQECADVAQVAEHRIRIPEGEISSISIGPKFEESEQDDEPNAESSSTAKLVL